MKKKSILGVLLLVVIALTGCSINNQAQLPQHYLSKEIVDIPNTGQIEVINQGFTKNKEGQTVVRFFTKFNDGSPEVGVEVPNTRFVNLGQNSIGNYTAVTASVADDSKPITLRLRSTKTNTVYFDRNYYFNGQKDWQMTDSEEISMKVKQ